MTGQADAVQEGLAVRMPGQVMPAPTSAAAVGAVARGRLGAVRQTSGERGAGSAKQEARLGAARKVAGGVGSYADSQAAAAAAAGVGVFGAPSGGGGASVAQQGMRASGSSESLSDVTSQPPASKNGPQSGPMGENQTSAAAGLGGSGGGKGRGASGFGFSGFGGSEDDGEDDDEEEGEGEGQSWTDMGMQVTRKDPFRQSGAGIGVGPSPASTQATAPARGAMVLGRPQGRSEVQRAPGQGAVPATAAAGGRSSGSSLVSGSGGGSGSLSGAVPPPRPAAWSSDMLKAFDLSSQHVRHKEAKQGQGQGQGQGQAQGRAKKRALPAGEGGEHKGQWVGQGRPAAVPTGTRDGMHVEEEVKGFEGSSGQVAKGEGELVWGAEVGSVNGRAGAGGRDNDGGGSRFKEMFDRQPQAGLGAEVISKGEMAHLLSLRPPCTAWYAALLNALAQIFLVYLSTDCDDEKDIHCSCLTNSFAANVQTSGYLMLCSVSSSPLSLPARRGSPQGHCSPHVQHAQGGSGGNCCCHCCG